MPRVKSLEHVPPAQERTFDTLRAVMCRMTDVIWQADATGNVTRIIPCRPAAPAGEGELDEMEVEQIAQLWLRSVRCAERFSAIYHVRRAGAPFRTFLVRAVPVLDELDGVLYWSGISAETEGTAEADTRFISEAAAVLSSSLNRVTIVNRLVQTSVDHFCDLCAVHTFGDEGLLELEAIAVRRSHSDVDSEELEDDVRVAVRSGQPLLLGRTKWARSTIVAPLFVGANWVGALSFLESERSSSFASRDLAVAVVVARQLAMALENIKTFERERLISERLRFLTRVTQHLFNTLDPVKIFEQLLESLCKSFADYAVAATVTGNRLSTLAASGTKGRFRESAEREILAALSERRPILAGEVSDLNRRSDDGGDGPLYEAAPPRSWMMVPLFSGGTTFGALLCCSNTRCYDAGELELAQEIGRRATFGLEHAESFARERRLVHTLQQATLPTRLARVEGATLSAVYRAAASEVQVGGDWYDAFDLDDHRVLLTVGDVTGHGLEASIVMGKLRHAINVVAMYEPDPVRILDAAERILLRRYPDSIATAFVAIFDSKQRTITYANAGHPYPFFRGDDGSLEQLEADGLPIGLRAFVPGSKSRSRGASNASLVAFFTDGLIEATHDMLAGESLLRQALDSNAILYVENPAHFLESFCVRDQSPDDVAILLLNFVEAQRWTFDSDDRRSARRARREFLDRLEAAAQPGSDFKAAEAIFGELASNAVQHAAGPVDVALEWCGNAVLHIIDRGESYSDLQWRQPDVAAESGRGLWLTQQLGAKLDIERLPGFGTHVRAVLPITAADLSTP